MTQYSRRALMGWRALVVALRRIIGAPDYDAYRAHLALHPGAAPLSPEDFIRDQLERRYTRPGTRCC